MCLLKIMEMALGKNKEELFLRVVQNLPRIPIKALRQKIYELMTRSPGFSDGSALAEALKAVPISDNWR